MNGKIVNTGNMRLEVIWRSQSPDVLANHLGSKYPFLHIKSFSDLIYVTFNHYGFGGEVIAEEVDKVVRKIEEDNDEIFTKIPMVASNKTYCRLCNRGVKQGQVCICMTTNPDELRERYCLDCSELVSIGATHCHVCDSIHLMSLSCIISIKRENDMSTEWQKEHGIVKEVEMPEPEVEQNTKSIATIGLNDPKLTRHTDVIQRRKELTEIEMISLAKELLTLSLYTQTPNVLVENCRFSIGMTLNGSIMQIAFYLKKVKRSERDKFTWKNLVKNTGRFYRGDTIKASKDTIADFWVSSTWQVVEKNFSHEFIQLLPTARILIDGELNKHESETLEDIAYLESVDEVGVSGHVE